jgi:hypothetical protein
MSEIKVICDGCLGAFDADECFPVAEALVCETCLDEIVMGDLSLKTPKVKPDFKPIIPTEIGQQIDAWFWKSL